MNKELERINRDLSKEFEHEQVAFLNLSKSNRRQFYEEAKYIPPVPVDLQKLFGLTADEWKKSFKADDDLPKKWTYQKDTVPCSKIPIYQNAIPKQRCTVKERALILRIVTLGLIPPNSVVNLDFLQGLVAKLDSIPKQQRGLRPDEMIPADIPYAPIVQDLLQTLGVPETYYELNVAQFTALPLWLQAMFVYVLFYAAIRLRDGESVASISQRLNEAHSNLRTSLPLTDKITQLQETFSKSRQVLMNPLLRLSWQNTLCSFMRLISIWLMFSPFHLSYAPQDAENRSGGSLVPLTTSLSVAPATAAVAEVRQAWHVAANQIVLPPQEAAIALLETESEARFLDAVKIVSRTTESGQLLAFDTETILTYRTNLIRRHEVWARGGDIPASPRLADTYVGQLAAENEVVLSTVTETVKFIHKELSAVEVNETGAFLRACIQSQLVRNPAFIVAILGDSYADYTRILQSTLTEYASALQGILSEEERLSFFSSDINRGILTQNYWTQGVGLASSNFTTFFDSALIPVSFQQTDYLYITTVFTSFHQHQQNIGATIINLAKRIDRWVAGKEKDAAVALLNQLSSGVKTSDARPITARLLFRNYWLRKKIFANKALERKIKAQDQVTAQQSVARQEIPLIIDEAERSWNTNFGNIGMAVNLSGADRADILDEMVKDKVWNDTGYFNRLMIWANVKNTQFGYGIQSFFMNYGIGTIWTSLGYTGSDFRLAMSNVLTWAAAGGGLLYWLAGNIIGKLRRPLAG